MNNRDRPAVLHIRLQGETVLFQLDAVVAFGEHGTGELDLHEWLELVRGVQGQHHCRPLRWLACQYPAEGRMWLAGQPNIIWDERQQLQLLCSRGRGPEHQQTCEKARDDRPQEYTPQ